MGIESPVHLLFIALVALIVLGPKRLPGLARAIGQGIREFRGALEQAQEEDPEPPEAPAPAANAQAPPHAEHAQPQAVAADTLHQPDQGA
jgi:sec-independent protein translocase protein TatA